MFCAIQIELFPFRYPITSATEYFGGIEISMCTWSDIRCPSSIWHSLRRASSRNTLPNCRRTYPNSSFLRYFGVNTTWIPVGTQVAPRPPHRSVQAQLRHTAPTLGGDGEANYWPWMKNSWLREEVIGQLCNPLPREVVLLTATPQRAQPEAHHMVAKGAECRKVGRHGVVCEVAPDDLRQPAPLFGDRLMHSPPQLLLYLPELYPHAIAPGFPFKLELALARPPTDEHEAQELEGSRLSQPTLHASLRGQRGGIVRSCSLGGLRINDQLELGRRLHGKIGSLSYCCETC